MFCDAKARKGLCNTEHETCDHFNIAPKPWCAGHSWRRPGLLEQMSAVAPRRALVAQRDVQDNDEDERALWQPCWRLRRERGDVPFVSKSLFRWPCGLTGGLVMGPTVDHFISDELVSTGGPLLHRADQADSLLRGASGIRLRKPARKRSSIGALSCIYIALPAVVGYELLYRGV